MRRYLYMIAMDIVENDEIEPQITNDTPVEAPKKAPATPEQRQEVKQELTAPAENASTLQIKGLKAVLKKLKDKDHPAEVRVANRLRVHGFRTVFVDDEVSVPDEETGRLQIVGLPDLDTGLEIKNVSSAKSENTISKYIGTAKKKRGLKQIVIDVSENDNLSDEEARRMIVSSLRRHSMSSALMVNHEGEIETIFYP